MNDTLDIRKQAYIDWVTGLDTEPPLEGGFNAGWLARDTDIERLKNNIERAIAILMPLFVQAQESDSPDEEVLGGALDVLTGWFGQNGQPLRRLDELEAKIERLRETLADTDQIVSDRDAEIERLRVVVEATRTYVFGVPSSGSKYDAVIAALAALDGPKE